MDRDEVERLPKAGKRFVRPYIGSQELIDGAARYCLWIEDWEADEAASIDAIRDRLDSVSRERALSKAESTRKFASAPHR
ncbi:type IIL restriction-modification enzyme MmeI, partial [Pseudomonas sp. FW305-124]|uniref:type IIL restriction-modification enzyme MmeI n=1 Tax=Pseudomonas sp. FW305-124 TaxID=2070649 RepID=UPI001C4923D1